MVSELPTKPTVTRRDRTGKRKKLGRKYSSSSSTGVSLENRVRETLDSLKIRVQRERLAYVQSKLEKNHNTLDQQLGVVERFSRERENCLPASAAGSVDHDGEVSGKNGNLFVQSQMALCREKSRQSPSTDEIRRPQICARLNPGNSDARKIVVVEKAKLEAVNRLPSYTAWTFVDQNELMTKDQSIDRRRRISYESNGRGWQGETFFCLDGQEEIVDVAKKTKVFRNLSEVEELISRVAVLEYGASRVVLETVADFLQVSVLKVESIFQSRPATEYGIDSRNICQEPAAAKSVSQVFLPSVPYNLPEDDVQMGIPHSAEANVERTSDQGSQEDSHASTTLGIALDTFDNLFCRRCLLFNCALHCLEEEFVEMNEIQPPSKMSGQDQLKPCSPWCRFLVSSNPSRPAISTTKLLCISGSDFQRSSEMSCATEMNQGYFPAAEGAIREDDDHPHDGPAQDFATNIRQLDNYDESDEELLIYDENQALEEAVEGLLNPHEKQTNPPTIYDNCGGSTIIPNNFSTLGEAALPIRRAEEDAESSSDTKSYRYDRKRRNISPMDGDVFTSSRSTNGSPTWDERRLDTSERWCSFNSVDEVQLDSLEEVPPSSPAKHWSRLEQDLCEKGMQIFGNDSCMIARNILKGLKSCLEIYEYIGNQDVGEAEGSGDESSSGRALSKRGNKLRRVEILPTGQVIRSKFRFGRKKVAPKFSLGPIRKRIGRDGGILSLCQQYTPCNCDDRAGCGKECPCVKKNMHCEKSCGCFKVCQNRFRGCQCAKSTCDRRNCPCFASGRECDPDMCKFCSIDCGHSSSPECHNMRILLRKKKRLLLAQSDVCTGWGVFTRHPLDKNEYIGEYTGELISHNEADRRGRIYDRETSFLFNLNDKLVVDAFRKGNKLKFANHSSHKPNCYAKVALVGGDHRVGIYAKQKVEAGEELLYDYQYEPEIAPLWATGPG